MIFLDTKLGTDEGEVRLKVWVQGINNRVGQAYVLAVDHENVIVIFLPCFLVNLVPVMGLKSIN